MTVLDILAMYMYIKNIISEFFSLFFASVSSEIFLNLFTRLKFKSCLEKKGYSTLIGSVTTFCPLPAPQISKPQKMFKKKKVTLREENY